MATYNIEIREFNGTDYDILYPLTTMENVDGLTSSISQINTNIQTANNRIGANDSKISTLQSQVGVINQNVSSLSGNVTNIYTELDKKQDKSGLGSLAFKDKATLTSATDVTGTLPKGNGGTGMTSSPSMLVNLDSTTADDVLKASPRPGVTGTLPVANGGTNATDAPGARSQLGITNIAVRPDYIISTTNLTPGTSELPSGTIYFYYEN